MQSDGLPGASPPVVRQNGSLVQSLPEELERILICDPEARRSLESLSTNEVHDLARWIESTPDPERRKQRIDFVVGSLR
jgi:uncharacterized protein YdeI (YjbR/CyaY-like superfamily)